MFGRGDRGTDDIERHVETNPSTFEGVLEDKSAHTLRYIFEIWYREELHQEECSKYSCH